MKKALVMLLFFTFPALATTRTLSWDPVVGAVSYNIYFVTCPTCPPFLVIRSVLTTAYQMDDAGFSQPWYVSVAGVDSSGTVGLSSTVVGTVMPAPAVSIKGYSWKSKGGIAISRPKIFDIDWSWDSPVWYPVGGAASGFSVGSPPILTIGNKYFCPYTANPAWGDALIPCKYSQ